jgi:hypothetical protein
MYYSKIWEIWNQNLVGKLLMLLLNAYQNIRMDINVTVNFNITMVQVWLLWDIHPPRVNFEIFMLHLWCNNFFSRT